MRKYKMELPDAVLAFKLLDTVCLDTKGRQLALTACTDLTFASMKSVLKRIFGGNPAAASGMGINQQTVYITEQMRQVMATKGSTENTGAGHKPTGQVWPEIKVCSVSVHISLGQGLSTQKRASQVY